MLAGKLELLLVELLAGELFELMDGVVELSADVLDSGIADFHGVVVGDIDHDEGDVAHTGDILVPLVMQLQMLLQHRTKSGWGMRICL